MAKEKLKRINPLEVVTHDDVIEKKELIQKIKIRDIASPKHHDRKSYSKEDITSLAKNIQATQTLLQPIVVRKKGKKYERMIGFRRIEAVKELGWKEIPAIVLDNISDESAMLIMLSENIQREDLNLFDQTVGIMEYIGVALDLNFEEVKKLLYHFRNIDSKTINDNEESNLKREKVEAITQKLGKITVASLINRLKIFSLKDVILDALKSGRITFTAAVEINKVDDENKVIEMINAVEAGELSIKGIKAYLKQLRVKPTEHKKIKYEMKANNGLLTLSIQDVLKPDQIKKLEKFLNTL